MEARGPAMCCPWHVPENRVFAPSGCSVAAQHSEQLTFAVLPCKKADVVTDGSCGYWAVPYGQPTALSNMCALQPVNEAASGLSRDVYTNVHALVQAGAFARSCALWTTGS